MSAESLRSVSGEEKLVVGLVSGAEFINHMFLVLLPPILGLLAADFDVSLALLGVAIGIQGAATTVFQLPFGYLSDNYTRTLGFGLSLGLGSAGAFVTAYAPTYLVLVLGQVLLGVGIAGHHPSHYPLLADAVPEALRGRAFSIRGFAGALGFATPPALITVVLSFPGTTWRHALALMGVMGLAYGAVALLLFRRFVGRGIKRPNRDESAPTDRGPALRERVIEEARLLVSSPPVVALGALTLVMSMVATGIRTYAVVNLTDGYGIVLDLANVTLSAMFIAGAGMMLVGGALADRFRPGSVLIAVYTIGGLLLVVFATHLLPALLAMGVAIGLEGFRTSSGPARDKLVDRFSSRAQLGQSFAVMTVGMMLGATIAPPLFGAMIETLGLRATFLAVAGCAFAAVAIAIGIIASYDELPFARPSVSADD